MVDFDELMQMLSVPRPNGSAALKTTCQHLTNWLMSHDIPHRLHTFRLYPYFLEANGMWVLSSQTLLALAVWLRWGWPTLLMAVVSFAVTMLEFRFRVPVVSALGMKSGENIVIEFQPSPVEPSKIDADGAKHEIILSAHYDTKTELLDHHQRAVLFDNSKLLLMLLLGLLGLVDQFLKPSESPWRNIASYIGALLTLPQLFLAWGLGLNSVLGRFTKPSLGAVDNGAACAILLGVADRLAKAEISPKQTEVTICIFTGEEVALQGSKAYVASRTFPLPTAAVNLEIMAQDGQYIVWQQDRDLFHVYPTAHTLNGMLTEVVSEFDEKLVPIDNEPAGTDAASFIKAGIPATSLATFDKKLKDGGFHRPTDNLGRVKFERLSEGVEILTHFIHRYDNEPVL